MMPQPLRRAVVAGSWYPGSPHALAAAVDRYLADVKDVPRGTIVGIVSPHAGLMYSGPVAAYAYAAVAGGPYDVSVLVGPSHHVSFEGVSIVPRGAFETPLGNLPIDEQAAAALVQASPLVRDLPAAHQREHSLEMQLPFLARVLPRISIVPLVMGHQSAETVHGLAQALARALAGRRVLLVASSDLSHYHEARSAQILDGRVIEAVERYDEDGLWRALERHPEHACGGGPIVAVMKAARALGATTARVLRYADSGDISGDKSAVVGYLAAAFGNFQ